MTQNSEHYLFKRLEYKKWIEKLNKQPMPRHGDTRNMTPEMDASSTHLEFILRFPEIRYLADVGFGGYCKEAASIIRPLWARSKNEGGRVYGKDTTEDRRLDVTFSISQNENDF
ncbi:MAG: hypothetical protein K6L73_14795 [Cellvibrionaceae bacterium]